MIRNSSQIKQRHLEVDQWSQKRLPRPAVFQCPCIWLAERHSQCPLMKWICQWKRMSQYSLHALLVLQHQWLVWSRPCIVDWQLVDYSAREGLQSFSHIRIEQLVSTSGNGFKTFSGISKNVLWSCNKTFLQEPSWFYFSFSPVSFTPCFLFPLICDGPWSGQHYLNWIEAKKTVCLGVWVPVLPFSLVHIFLST